MIVETRALGQDRLRRDGADENVAARPQARPELRLQGRHARRLRPRQAAGHSGFGRAGVDEAAEPHREFDIFAHMRLALALIAVQQSVRRSAPDHARQFPGEIGGVAHARAKALAEEGRRLMGGVARDQQSTVAPAFRDRRMGHVAGGAFEVGVLGRDPALQQTPDMARFGHHRGVFVGAQRDLPAPALIDAAHIGRRSGGIAELHAVIAERGNVALQESVDDQPALVKAEILQRGPDQAARQGASAVATDDIFGAAAMQRPRRQGLELDVDAIGILPDRVDVRTQAHVHVRLGGGDIAQRAFEVGLVKAKADVPALRADIERTRPVEDQAPLGVDEMHARRNARAPGDAVGDAQRLEHAHRFVVEMDRARQRENLGLALEHGHRQPAIGEQISPEWRRQGHSRQWRHPPRSSPLPPSPPPSPRARVSAGAPRSRHSVMREVSKSPSPRCPADGQVGARTPASALRRGRARSPS